MDNQNQGENKARKLSSAQELKGKRAVANKGGKKKIWLSALGMVLALGLAIGAYFLSGVIKPEEEAVVTPQATSSVVRLVNRQRVDVDSVTVTVKGQESYTVESNILYDEAGNATGTKMMPVATPEPVVTTAPEATAEAAAAAEEAAEEAAVEEAPAEEATPVALPEYTIRGDYGFELDQSVASNMIGYASSLSATQLVAENVADVSVYGLQDPAIKVKMNYKDGTTDEWYFGDKVPTSSAYYIMQKGGDDVFTTYSAPYTYFARPYNELHVVKMPMTIADYSAIRSVKIEQAGKETVELAYDPNMDLSQNISVNSIRLVQPFEYDAHSERADAMMQNAAAMNIKTYAGRVSEVPEAGMDAPRAVITVVAEDIGTLVVKVGKQKDASTVYVQVDDSDKVYLADATLFSFIDNAKASYLVDQFSNLVNILRVEGMTIATPETTYEMRIEREPELDANGQQVMANNGKPATIDTYYFDEQVTTEALFKDMYQEIIGTLVSKISDDRNLNGEVIASVTYHLNVDMETFTVEYLAYDNEYYAVRRDGMTLFLIKKDKVDSMLVSLGQYREGTYVEK